MAGRDPLAALQSRYTVVRELGRGGVAAVYLAADASRGERVAIKVLHPELAATRSTTRFLKEIELLTDFDHPNILSIIDSGEADGLPYYVMPYVEGESLRRRLGRERLLGIDDAVTIACEVASGLAYLHDREVVHRDIKPENILLAEGGALISDFGIAHALDVTGGERLTEPGLAVGTPLYMSPEQGGGDAWVDARGDIYSLGCVLYEMLTGSPPFTGPTAQVIISRHALDTHAPIRTVQKNIAPTIEAAVAKALEKLPTDRFQTASEFIEALRAPPDSAPALQEKPNRTRVWIAAGVAGLVLAGAAIWGVWSFDRTPLDPNKVVVFPLTGRTSADRASEEGWGSAIAIEMALEHTEPLRWLDAWDELTPEQRRDASTVTPGDERDLSRRLGAAYYIKGVFGTNGDSASVILRLHDVAGDSIVAQQSAGGDTSSSNYPQLSLRAMPGLLLALVDPGREIDLSALSDRDPGAIALWMQGERAYRHSRFTPSIDLYERAVEQDSALALAALKGAQAAFWRNQHALANSLLATVAANQSGLPDRYRLLRRGYEHYVRGRAESAVANYEEALASDPEWSEAAMALGEVYFHLLPSGGRPDSIAKFWLGRAFELDSSFTPPLVHLADFALRKGDTAESDRIIARLNAENTDSSTIRRLSLMLRCVSDPAAYDWSEDANTDPLTVLLAAQELSVAAAQPICAERGFRTLLDGENTSSADVWGATLGLQGILIAQGRVAAAERLLDREISRGNPQPNLLYLFDAVAGVGMEQKAAKVEGLLAGFGVDYAAAGPHTRWLMGLRHARLGEFERVEAIRSTFLTDSNTESASQMMVSFDARVTAAMGDTTRAIGLLTSLTPSAPRRDVAWDLHAPLALDKLMLAQLYESQGFYEEAHSVASIFDQRPIAYLPILRQSLEIRERAATELGWTELRDRYRDRLAALTN